MLAYLQGLSLGLAYVAPIGVQNLFVINAGLSQPQAAAYRTALIVIFFDVTLALAGFFGIGALIEHSELIRKGVLLAGSLVVMYMGLRLMLSREVAGPAKMCIRDRFRRGRTVGGIAAFTFSLVSAGCGLSLIHI